MYLQRRINLQPYAGTVSVLLEQVYIVNLKEGDLLYDLKVGYHGKVITARGDGMFKVKWFKWDPAIEMPMLSYLFSPGQVFRIVNPEPVLDLSQYERGGPYN